MSTSTVGPRALPESFLGCFFRGLSYPLASFGFLSRHRLWRLAMVPAVVNTVLLAGLVGMVFWWLAPLLSQLEEVLTPETSDIPTLTAVLAVLGRVLTWIVWLLAPVIVLVVCGIVLVLVGQAVASPFLDLLSEKVESLVLNEPTLPFGVGRTIRAVLVSLADLVWGTVFWLGVNIPLLLCHLVPLIGTMTAAVLGFGFTALLLSQEFVGLPLTRQLASYPARWRVTWSNRALTMGCGTGIMFLLMVPGLNLLLLPMATVGGTLLYCDLKAAGRLDAKPPNQVTATAAGSLPPVAR